MEVVMGFANVASDGDSFFRSLNKQVGLTPHYYFIPTVYISLDVMHYYSKVSDEVPQL